MKVDEIKSIVDREGLGYAIMEYLPSSSIDDHRLASLWEKAYRAILDVDYYLDLSEEPGSRNSEDNN